MPHIKWIEPDQATGEAAEFYAEAGNSFIQLLSVITVANSKVDKFKTVRFIIVLLSSPSSVSSQWPLFPLPLPLSRFIEQGVCRSNGIA